METTALAAAAATAGAVALLWLGTVKVARARTLHTHLHQRIRTTPVPSDAGVPDVEAAAALSLRPKYRFGRVEAELRLRLARAGLTITPARFLLMQVAVAGLAGSLGLALAPVPGPLRPPVAAVLAACGFVSPLLVLAQRARQRQDALVAQLPQAIDSMAGTLQVGSSLPQALVIIAREMPPPISEEFGRVVRELELGIPLTETLDRLQDRVRSADLLLLSSAVAIQQRVGGDLAQVFKGISQTIRERLRIRSEIQVLTAQGRYSAYIVTALPVLLFAFMWTTSREYMSQLFLPESRMLVVGSLVGLALGYASMRRIVSVDV